MKKNFKYALIGAIALTGAVSFSACSSSDEIVDNPNYNPADNTVKTQFALSLSSGGANKVTRQTGAIVQNAQNHDAFRGMKKMTLIPFGAEPGASSTPLGPVIGPLTMDKTSTPSSTASKYDNTTNNAVVYTNIAVPTTTSYFLFYGQATEAASSTNFDNGALTVAGLYGASEDSYSFTTPNGIRFTPVQIYDDDKNTEKKVGTDLIALLNSLLTATDGESSPKKWGDYTSEDNSLLRELYENFITLKTASSYNVAAMLVDLYTSLEGLASTTNNTNGKSMAAALRAAIAAGFNSNVTENNIKYPGYPGNLGMPDGAALISYNSSTNEFALAATNSGNYPASTIAVQSYNDYVYPANLQYFVNSGIKTSTVQQSTNFSSKSNWTGCTDLYTAGTLVTPTTKSVALVNEIQYGVGNLNTIVNQLSNTTYIDHNAEAIDMTNGGFTLTGVLIGGQGEVGWNFVPTAAGSKTIYDNVINSGTLSTTVSANNFTLGLETLPANGDKSTGVVNIALELQNNTGKDFMGKDGLIPAGGKFYLAGKLDPWDNLTNHTGSDPATASTVDGVLSVFKQDYLTTATITIAAGTLDGTYAKGGFAEATNTIPDLRTPQSEVCFSVDMTWKSGLEFTVTF